MLAEKYPVKYFKVNPKKLHWTPYLTDIKRDKFSIHNKKTCIKEDATIGDTGSHSLGHL